MPHSARRARIAKNESQICSLNKSAEREMNSRIFSDAYAQMLEYRMYEHTCKKYGMYIHINNDYSSFSPKENSHKHPFIQQYINIDECTVCGMQFYLCKFCPKGKCLVVSFNTTCNDHTILDYLLPHLAFYHTRGVNRDIMLYSYGMILTNSLRTSMTLRFRSIVSTTPQLILLKWVNLRQLADKLTAIDNFLDCKEFWSCLIGESDIYHYNSEEYGPIIVDILMEWDYECVNCGMEYDSGMPAIDIVAAHSSGCLAAIMQK